MKNNLIKKETFLNRVKFNVMHVLLCTFLTVFSEIICAQTLPINNGDKILWIGNSFSSFYGPIAQDVQSLLSVSNPSINTSFLQKGKGFGTVKEYATWSSLGIINEIRTGGWDYVIIQTWADAYNLTHNSTLENGSPDNSPNPGYPSCQDTLVKYYKIMANEIRNAGAKTIYFQPHLNGGDIALNYTRAMECMNRAKAEVPDAFYASTADGWENVRAAFPQTTYNCPGSNLPKGGFIDFMYSDCIHQSCTGITLDAFTFYTIFTGKAGIDLNPAWASYADNFGPYRPEFKKYLARTGYYVGAQLTGITPVNYPDTQAPSTPTGLTATAIAPNYVKITWNTSTDNYVVNVYEIYKDGVLSGSVYLPGYTVPGLTAGTNHTISVRAKDVDGNRSVAAVVNVTTPAEYENLALNKTATSSSVMNGSTLPSKAVDGNTDGTTNYFHSQQEASPWWQVDIGSINNIGDVEIWNYTECCLDMMQNYYLFVSDNPFASNDPNVLKNQSGVWYSYHTDYPNPASTIPVNRTGRYVRVQLAGTNYLHFAEVKVFKSGGSAGGDTTPPSSPANLVASNIAQTGYTLSWAASTDNIGVVSYEVFVGPTSKGTTSSTSMNITGLPCNTQYAVDVTAKDAAGNVSAHRTPLGVTTAACFTGINGMPAIGKPTSPPFSLSTLTAADGKVRIYTVAGRWIAELDNVPESRFLNAGNNSLLGKQVPAGMLLAAFIDKKTGRILKTRLIAGK